MLDGAPSGDTPTDQATLGSDVHSERSLGSVGGSEKDAVSGKKKPRGRRRRSRAPSDIMNPVEMAACIAAADAARAQAKAEEDEVSRQLYECSRCVPTMGHLVHVGCVHFVIVLRRPRSHLAWTPFAARASAGLC